MSKKSVQILSVIVLLAALVACGRYSNPTLDHAEAIMEEHPDSALAMLESIDTSILTSDATRAKYALLLTRAKFLNNQETNNDSLISIALDYYDDKGNDYYRMLSNYYYGLVKYDMEDYASGLASMFKAIDYADSDNDSFWLGRIYRTISDIYLDTYNNAEELEYAKKEYEYFNKSGRQPHLDYALCDLARAYNNAEKYDSAIIITNKILDVAKIEDDPNLYLSMQRIKALAYFSKGDYQASVDEYSTICGSGMDTETDSAYLGMAYLKNNELTRAEEIFNRLNVTSEPVMLNFQYLVYKYSNQHEKALNSLQTLDSITESMLSGRMTKNITTSLINQLMLRKSIAEAKSKTARYLLISVIIIVAILIVLFSQLFNSYRNRNLLEIERNIEFVQQLQGTLEKKEKSFIEVQYSIRKLIESKYNILAKFNALTYEDSNAASTKKDISDLVNNLIKDITGKKKQGLIDFVNTHFSDVYSQFCNDFPDLKDKERDLFLFSALGFSNNAIALFMQTEKVSSIYNMRRHLKDKIKKSTNVENCKYLKYL